jgi:hypothetical protein
VLVNVRAFNVSVKNSGIVRLAAAAKKHQTDTKANRYSDVDTTNPATRSTPNDRKALLDDSRKGTQVQST